MVIEDIGVEEGKLKSDLFMFFFSFFYCNLLI